MRPLTRRQRDMLDALEAYQRAHGYPPTVRELATLLHLRSTATVANRLAKLEAQDYISRVARRPRCITVLDPTAKHGEAPRHTTRAARPVQHHTAWARPAGADVTPDASHSSPGGISMNPVHTISALLDRYTGYDFFWKDDLGELGLTEHDVQAARAWLAQELDAYTPPAD